MESLISKKMFENIGDRVWFYNGAESPPLKGSVDAVRRYMEHRSFGPGGRSSNAEVEDSCKSNLAKMLGGQPNQIALLSNSSDVISMIAGALGLKAGDNVVVNKLEFPSGILPWLVLQEAGVEVRFVDHENWRVSPEDILSRVDARTRIVVSSHVSYLSGAKLDYKELYRALKQTDTLLMLDATQSLGITAVDINETDFVVCSSYKWLLGIHGLGILGINPARTSDFMPRAVGWRGVTDMFSPLRDGSYRFQPDARRFETGYPSYPCVYALDYSTRLLLDTGIPLIEDHVLGLGAELISKLEAAGYELMTPREPEFRAGNICVVSDQGEEISAELERQGIYLWGGDGRFRASVHAFNDSTDVDRLIAGLSAIHSKGEAIL